MKHAFSLVELSIVLVILGLLVGGILTGQSLIRAAELRSVTTEYQNYQTAVMTFRDKYFALPGDIDNATDFWGASANCPGTNANTTTAVKETCNGDKNGNISVASSTANETFRFWQHLANAGLIEGAFTGVADSTTASDPHSVLDQNIPASKLSNGGWSVFYLSAKPISNTSYFDGSYLNIFFFGATDNSNVAYQPLLSAEEAWNIDTKIDDGKPAIGKLRTLERDGGTSSDDCSDLAPSSSVSLADSNYALTNSGSNCSLIFITDF